MCFHGPASNCQSEAETAAASSILAAGGINPVKTFEDMRQVLHRNAITLIADADFHLFIICLAGQRDRRAGRTVLDGVIQQVDEGLAQHRPVA